MASSSAETTQALARRKEYMSSFLGGSAARRGQATRRPINIGRKGGTGVGWEGWDGEVGAMGAEGENVVEVPLGGLSGEVPD